MMRRHSFRLGSYRMRIAWLPAVVAVALLALMLWAGFWQLGRAEDKRRAIVEETYRGSRPPLVVDGAFAAGSEPARLRHRRAEFTGRYRVDRQYLLDNRTHHGVAGYHVLTPMRLEGGDVHVLVNRGWVPVGAHRARLPDVAVSGDTLTEEGLIVEPPGSGLELGPAGYDDRGWPRVVQRVDLARIEAELGAPLLPFVIRLSPASAHGYLRDWRLRAGLSPERHLGYAVQWFAMAAALAILCVIVCVRRAPEQEPEQSSEDRNEA